MSENEIDTTKNTNLVKEQNLFPSISSKDIIYPTLNMVFHLIPSKDSQFSFPQDGSIVFSNINVALSYIYQIIEYQKFLQSEEILFLLKGMWISEPNGSYTQLNDVNLIKLYSLTRQPRLKWKSKGLSLMPVKFSPKSHFIFRFKDNVSFQLLFSKIVEDQLKLGNHPTLEEIHGLAIGNGYRSSFYFQNYIEQKDFKRIAFFLLNCPFFNVQNGKIMSLNDLSLEEEEEKENEKEKEKGKKKGKGKGKGKEKENENEADIIYSIILRNDPLRKGMKIHDIKKFVGEKFDDKSIKKTIHKDHRFYDYFGFVGIKPKITDFSQLSFDDSNSHNTPPPAIKSSKAIQQPNLQNVVFSELYKIQEPLTVESFCSKITGTEFYEHKQITLISSDQYDSIEKIVSNLPNAMFDDDDNIWPVPLECEIDIYGGLYFNAYQNVTEDNELLRIQTSNQTVSFLYELDKSQLPDYIDPDWYKPDEVYNKIYPKKKKKSKEPGEPDSDEDDDSKKKKKEEKRHKEKHKNKKKNRSKNKDDDEEEEEDTNDDDDDDSKKKNKKKSKRSKDESSSDADEESSESNKDDESESEEEDTDEDSSDDQEYNHRYRKRRRRTKQRLPPKHILEQIRSLNLQEEQPSDDPNKTNESHPILHHYSDIKGTEKEPKPNRPPEMTDSQYLIYKAMFDRCGMKNKQVRHFYCRDIAIYLTGEEINGFVMDDTEQAAKVISDEISHSKFFSSQKSQFAYIPQEEKVRLDQPIYNTFRDMFAGTLKMMHKRNSVDMPIFNYEDTANEMVGIRFYSKSTKSIIQFTKDYKYKQPFTSIAKSDDAFYWDDQNKTFGLKKYCPNFVPQKKTEDKKQKEKNKQDSQEDQESEEDQESQEKAEKAQKSQKQEKQEKQESQENPDDQGDQDNQKNLLPQPILSLPLPQVITVKKKRGRKRKEEKLAMEAEMNKLKTQQNDVDDEKTKEEKKEERKERREKERQEKERIRMEKKEKREKERERKEKERLEKKEKKEKAKELREKKERKEKKDKIKKKDSKKFEEEEDLEEEENIERHKRKNKRIENVLLNIKKARNTNTNEPIRSKRKSTSSRLSSGNSLSNYTGSDNDLENDDDIKNDSSDSYDNEDEVDNEDREDDYTPWPTPLLRSTEKVSQATFQDLKKEVSRISLKDENKSFPSFMNFTPRNDEREDMSARIMAIQKTEMFGDHKYALDDQIPDLMEKFGKGYSPEDFINNVYFSLGMNYEKELDESPQ